MPPLSREQRRAKESRCATAYPSLSQFTRRSSTRSKKSTGSSSTFVRTSGGFTGKTSSSSAAAMAGQPLSQGPYKYVRAQDYMREKDLEYGYAKMQQGARVRSVSWNSESAACEKRQGIAC